MPPATVLMDRSLARGSARDGVRASGGGAGSMRAVDGPVLSRVGRLPAADQGSGILVRDASGNLYGTTVTNNGGGGYGTVFKIKSNGTENVLHVFAGQNDGRCDRSAHCCHCHRDDPALWGLSRAPARLPWR